ncbi:unnamed protein product [Camellia sinensis]
MGLGLVSLLAKMEMVSTSDYTSVVSINLFVALLCTCIVLGHLLEENRWMNESITALIIGFQVKKKQFFRNFMTIMMFGAIGTLISFAIISFGAMNLFKKMNIGSLDIGDYLAIGAIFSATDSVCTLQVLNQDETPLLYSLVFGEGVVNDATSIVLFNAIQSFDLTNINSSTLLQLVGNFLYLFFTSTLLGVAAGLLSAFIIRKLYFGRESMNVGHRNGSVAELFFLSAILTVFFCGIVMSHYTWHNVTESSRVTTKHAFATLSFMCEIFIFLYVGMDALDIEKWRFVSDSPGTSIGVSSILLGLILVGRAAFVFPLSFLSNLTRKSSHEKIELKQQVTIWWAGLMRGAVSIALAYNQAFTKGGHTQLRANAVMITSTITVVLFSTMVFGLMTKPLVRLLLPSPNNLSRMLSTEPTTPKSFIVPLLANGQGSEADLCSPTVPRPNSLRMLLATPSRSVHYYWRKFDNGFMRPVFGGRGFVPVLPGSPPEQSDHQLQ